jgi:hypothetical protein
MDGVALQVQLFQSSHAALGSLQPRFNGREVLQHLCFRV